jgi:hypothetical protein
MLEAYHGVTAAQHQANFNKFSAQGYRIISLSVYGDPSDARYAAVWVQRSGPAWVAVHGVDTAGYQTFFNNWTAKGFVPVLVSATGAVSDAIFGDGLQKGRNFPNSPHPDGRKPSAAQGTTGTRPAEQVAGPVPACQLLPLRPGRSVARSGTGRAVRLRLPAADFASR